MLNRDFFSDILARKLETPSEVIKCQEQNEKDVLWDLSIKAISDVRMIGKRA